METWRKVWREGVAPQLSRASLLTLEKALLCDDERLLQGATTLPPPLQNFRDCAVEGACAIAYCGWQAEGRTTIGDVEEFFAQMCFEVDKALGEPSACRWFINWFDETPRDEMRALLLQEIERLV